MEEDTKFLLNNENLFKNTITALDNSIKIRMIHFLFFFFFANQRFALAILIHSPLWRRRSQAATARLRAPLLI